MGTSWNNEAIKLYAYQLGKRIARQRLFRVETAQYYLFNGHKLPALPKEWNQGEQPFCAIQHSNYNSNIYYFYTASEPFRPDSAYSDFEMVAPTCVSMLDITTGEGWGELELRTQNRHMSAKYFIWTNCDIPYADGTIALEASDPIPVYE